MGAAEVKDINVGDAPKELMLHAKVIMLAQQYEMSRSMIDNLQVAEYTDHVLDRLVYQMKTYVVSAGEETIECNEAWPANWWEALKDRWFPAWALRRWPIVWKEHHLNRTFHRAICPHIDVPHHQGTDLCFRFLKEYE